MRILSPACTHMYTCVYNAYVHISNIKYGGGGARQGIMTAGICSSRVTLSRCGGHQRWVAPVLRSARGGLIFFSSLLLRSFVFFYCSLRRDRLCTSALQNKFHVHCAQNGCDPPAAASCWYTAGHL